MSPASRAIRRLCHLYRLVLQRQWLPRRVRGADRRRLALEALEDRTAPSTTLQFMAPDQVEFSGGDALYLRAPQGVLEWSADGSTYAQDLDLATDGVQALTLSSRSVIGANVDQVDITDLLFAGGKFDTANQLTIDPGETISSRQIIGGDPATAASIGDSNDLFFRAPHITISDGARILAHADNGFQAGNVSFKSNVGYDLTWANVTSYFQTQLAQTSISVGAATITGNNITLLTSASTAKVANFELDYDALANQVAAQALAIMTGTPRLTFAGADGQPPTITRSLGSWIADGFAVGQTISVQGSDNNDGGYTVTAVSNDTLTLAG